MSSIGTQFDPQDPRVLAIVNKGWEKAGMRANPATGGLDLLDRNGLVSIGGATVPSGLIADGTGDNSAAIQAALNLAKASGTMRVYLPAGLYRLTSRLTIPKGVELRGCWGPGHAPYLWFGINGLITDENLSLATVLRFEVADATTNRAPYVMVNALGRVGGLAIVEGRQTTTPVPFDAPFAIQLARDSVCSEVNLFNVTDGIAAIGDGQTGSDRFVVRNVVGQPCRFGLVVDNCLDCPRIEDVHFVFQYDNNLSAAGGTLSNPASRIQWQIANGIGFDFRRCDEIIVSRCFAFFYLRGFRFSRTTSGSTMGTSLGDRSGVPGNGNVYFGATYGTFTACCADLSCTPVYVDDTSSDGGGVTYQGGGFIAIQKGDVGLPATYDPGDTRNVIVGGSHPIAFVGSRFVHAHNNVCLAQGASGCVATFSGCTFQDWDGGNVGDAALLAVGTSTIQSVGNYFMVAKKQHQGAGNGKVFVNGGIVTGAVNNLDGYTIQSTPGSRA